MQYRVAGVPCLVILSLGERFWPDAQLAALVGCMLTSAWCMQVQLTTELAFNGINYDPFHPDGYSSMRKVPPHPPPRTNMH